jgi:hypothetical protein
VRLEIGDAHLDAGQRGPQDAPWLAAIFMPVSKVMSAAMPSMAGQPGA